MLKKAGLTAALGLAALLFSAPLSARDRYRDDDRQDRYRYENGYRNSHEEHEWRERMERQRRHEREEWLEHHRYRRGYSNGYYGNGYYNNGGYYDQYGYWHGY